MCAEKATRVPISLLLDPVCDLKSAVGRAHFPTKPNSHFPYPSLCLPSSSVQTFLGASGGKYSDFSANKCSNLGLLNSTSNPLAVRGPVPKEGIHSEESLTRDPKPPFLDADSEGLWGRGQWKPCK